MKTYLTVLTTDDYAIGAIALWESLRRTRPQYGFVVLLTRLVSERCEQALIRVGISTVRIDRHLERPTGKNTNRGLGHWDNTFSKLLIFELVQYEKIVYLDSDMMVLRNLDDLFDKPHMSAMVPDMLIPSRSAWVQFCSGLMVIEPKVGLASAIMAHTPAVERKTTTYGDQNLLHEHFTDWPSRPELHLEQTYGVFPRSVDRYVKEFGYNVNLTAPDERTIAVVHFVGSRKPWTWSGAERCFRLSLRLVRGEFVAVRILREYLRLIRSVRARLC
ncbi:MAG: glycosyltransferase [Candidatus Korobacteraceae bacterium]